MLHIGQQCFLSGMSQNIAQQTGQRGPLVKKEAQVFLGSGQGKSLQDDAACFLVLPGRVIS